MLIDATHKEELRVAVTDGNKLIEYDYESQSRRPIKGSIFLAKVTRVEPSLQAAFVNFGGNRHGFLPFSEIHPDYFKIPVADREALIAEQESLLQEHDDEEALIEKEAEENEKAEAEVNKTDNISTKDNADAKSDPVKDNTDTIDNSEKTAKDKKSKTKVAEKTENKSTDDKAADKEENTPTESTDDTKKVKSEDKATEESPKETDKTPEESDNSGAENKSEDKSEDKGEDKGENKDGSQDDSEKTADNKKGKNRRNYRGRGNKRSQYRNRNVEVVGGDEIENGQKFRFNLRRKYKIQEVVKRGQIVLIQANKEERGNKGAAVGTYLSLPGRYCVLMPNSPRGGGVSRKIANSKDRARMREIVKDLEIPKGMSVIVRTAGVSRNKAEIKRDLDYLIRLWNNIRELTLESTAPAIVYEEADLIKRSVRDLYTRDIDEIHVAGENGYKTAKDFMKMMIPSHVKKIKKYESDQMPLFNRYQVESQINEIGQPEVRLKSGGYLVINPTEALVSVDVNSGKATKGRHIEETAVRTNLEAAEEVARQLKLRDLGGLVVIDFIDMEDRRNNAKVERRMKEALSPDRARVQVGRISSFGLMELSRQRLSSSLIEAQFEQCKKCSGIGLIRTADAMSIMVLRAIEEEGIRARAAQIIVQVNSDVVLYILNYKRKRLAQIEETYNIQVLLRVDDNIAASEYLVEVSKPAAECDKPATATATATADPESTTESTTEDETKNPENPDGEKSRRRGRRGGRGRNKQLDENKVENSEPASKDEDKKDTSVTSKPDDEKKSEDKSKPVEKENKKTTSPANDDKNKVKKEAAKSPKPKTATKAKTKKDTPPSPVAKSVKKIETPPEPSVASMHETVNQAPKQKKKGWWNRLVE